MAHPLAVVFDAFARPELLAQWWGPDGFTNAFEVFDFRPGGRWKYVMHGPKGAQFQNESTFVDLQPGRGLSSGTSQNCGYLLTVALDASDAGTLVTWAQEFEDPAVAARVRHIVKPANEQNRDRLQAVLAAQIR